MNLNEIKAVVEKYKFLDCEDDKNNLLPAAFLIELRSALTAAVAMIEEREVNQPWTEKNARAWRLHFVAAVHTAGILKIDDLSAGIAPNLTMICERDEQNKCFVYGIEKEKPCYTTEKEKP